MSAPTVASREDWLAARKALLEEEKAHSRAGDALAAKRRALPWVKVETDYVFETEDGPKSLADLFGGRSQLIVQHFMFGPDWDAGCMICSFWADGYEPMLTHLQNRDIAFTAVSRAPLEKLLAYRQRMGWTFPWASAHGNSFNEDYGVSATEAEIAAGEMTYNSRKGPFHAPELHGTSVFARDDSGAVYHTYSTYGRGLDRMNGLYGFIDLTPKGRDEDSLPFSMAWVRRHDEYEG